MPSRRYFVAIAIFISAVASSCASLESRLPVPKILVEDAQIEGFSDIRYWGDQLPSDVDRVIQEHYLQLKKERPELLRKKRFVVNILAISGGGSNGAFGAGLLNGWSARGTRPEFEIVTGISTGALSAPLVFLGSNYDPLLKKIYTSYQTSDLVNKQILSGVLGGQALGDSKPLLKIISEIVDQEFLSEVAQEHNRGRRLYVGTTNLDAQRPVIWDMGAIAASGHKESLQLFRSILLASASLPGIFPPVKIKVRANGQNYDELHVDGGTTNQVFVSPTQLKLSYADKKMGINPRRRLYIIRNGHIGPEWQAIKPTTPSIAARSVSTLIKTQGNGDLVRIYLFSRSNRIVYNLAFIPQQFTAESKEAFDREYMTELYQYAFDLGKAGYPWSKNPPGFR